MNTVTTPFHRVDLDPDDRRTDDGVTRIFVRKQVRNARRGRGGTWRGRPTNLKAERADQLARRALQPRPGTLTNPDVGRVATPAHFGLETTTVRLRPEAIITELSDTERVHELSLGDIEFVSMSGESRVRRTRPRSVTPDPRREVTALTPAPERPTEDTPRWMIYATLLLGGIAFGLVLALLLS